MPKSDQSPMDIEILTTPRIAKRRSSDPLFYTEERPAGHPIVAPITTKTSPSRDQALLSVNGVDRSIERRASPQDHVFTEDDPRACPRDPEEFRLAVALELDRLRANKKIYNK